MRSFFFFNDTATTEIYTLSLHDALPIFDALALDRFAVDVEHPVDHLDAIAGQTDHTLDVVDRKSTRLHSSHDQISYAVFCLKKKRTWNSYPEAELPPVDEISLNVDTLSG